MALNTAPSFGSPMMKSAANDMAGQRAVQRRSMPSGPMTRPTPRPPMMGAGGGGGVGRMTDRVTGATRVDPRGSTGGGGIRPTFGNGGFGFGFNGAAPMGNMGNIKTQSMGYNPAGAQPPMRMQADPLMANDAPSPIMGDGMVAATAPPPDMSGQMDRLREKMGGNTGITGGMNPGRRPGMFSMY